MTEYELLDALIFTSPSKQLDGEIAKLFEWTYVDDRWTDPQGMRHTCPPAYTSSIDVCLDQAKTYFEEEFVFLTIEPGMKTFEIKNLLPYDSGYHARGETVAEALVKLYMVYNGLI